MKGPFMLAPQVIDEEVTEKTCGNFALGHVEGNKFIFFHVGRSDKDLNKRLKGLVGKTKQSHFKYSYAPSAEVAFEKECDSYHDSSSHEHKAHPERRAGSLWQCPRCNVYEG
jgi:hypothetical protein